MTPTSRTSGFESGQFKGSEWGTVTVSTNVPEKPKHGDTMAMMYAEVAYFELEHLLPGETVELSGEVNAMFWKLDEDEVLCKFNGGTGVYKHDSDENWDIRRLYAERAFTSLVTGEDW